MASTSALISGPLEVSFPQTLRDGNDDEYPTFQVKDSRGQIRQEYAIRRPDSVKSFPGGPTSDYASASARGHPAHDEALRRIRYPLTRRHRVTYTFAHRPSEQGGAALESECSEQTREWARERGLDLKSMVEFSEAGAPVSESGSDCTIRAWGVRIKSDPPTLHSWRLPDDDLWQRPTQNAEPAVILVFEDLPPSDTAITELPALIPSIEHDDPPSSIEDAVSSVSTASVELPDAEYQVTLKIWKRREEGD